MEKDGKKEKIRSSAASGAVAVIFLIIGFQAAVFVLKVLEKPAVRDAAAPGAPVTFGAPAGYAAPATKAERDSAPAACRAPPPSAPSRYEGRGRGVAGVCRERPSGNGNQYQYRRKEERSVESFRFDPNTVSVEDLVRLGLSPKQAACIERYREKGGKFRRKEDFRKMYVVSDSLYSRLEEFIDTPKLELNGADSTALTTLKGIGPWYAAKIVRRREALGGFYTPAQLMEIRGIDSTRYAGISSYVQVDTSLIVRIDICSAPQESLAAHPYIGRAAAGAICRYRAMEGVDSISADVLVKENIIDADVAEKLRNYLK